MAFYRIKEAAQKVGVLPHVLRFWETQFPHVQPQKSSRGQRMYSEAHISLLRRVKNLLYTQGYSIQGAKKVLENPNKAVDENISQKIKSTLISQKSSYLQFIDEVKAELDALKDFTLKW